MTGCGSSLYLTRSRTARKSFTEAQTIGAERSAPYEFYGAQVRIQEAARQAARAEYGSAIVLLEKAEALSEKAIQTVHQLAIEPTP